MNIVSLQDFDRSLAGIQRESLIAVAYDREDATGVEATAAFHRSGAARLMRMQVLNHASGDALRLPMSMAESMQEAGDGRPGTVVERFHEAYLRRYAEERATLETQAFQHIWGTFRALLHELGVPEAFAEGDDMRNEFLATVTPPVDEPSPIPATDAMPANIMEIATQCDERLRARAEWLDRLREYLPVEANARMRAIIADVSIERLLRTVHELYGELLSAHGRPVAELPPRRENVAGPVVVEGGDAMEDAA